MTETLSEEQKAELAKALELDDDFDSDLQIPLDVSLSACYLLHYYYVYNRSHLTMHRTIV